MTNMIDQCGHRSTLRTAGYFPRARRRSLSLLAVLFVASTGCATAFNKTGAALGDAMTELPRALVPEGSLASRLCEQRSRFDFLHHRVEGSRAYAWDTPPRWTEWWSTHLRDKARPDLGTWADHCGRIDQVSKSQAASARLLAAYGRALRALVDEGQYEGEDLKSIAASTANIVESLGGDNFLAKNKSAIANAGDPMKQIMNLLLAAYTRSQLSDAITRSAPAIDLILAAIQSYVEAVESERTDALSRLEAVLNAAEPSFVGADRTADAAQAFVFHEFAVRWTEDLRAPAARQKAYLAALQELRDSHKSLAAEANRALPSEHGLSQIRTRAAAAGAALTSLGSLNN